ncbi:DASS family sodium-coupled anion symporter [Sporomusa aerivorans]|uniref:SLC13 family permease n=1 Tax=Sporomusa aerivorans TaxID=204936 RepID=UPI00352B6E70
MANAFETWGKKYGLLLGFLVGLAIWLFPVSAAITETQHKLLAIFGGAVITWVTIGVNFAVSSIITSSLLYFWVGNLTGQVKNGVLVRSTDFALSQFSSASLWLLLTGFVISIAMTKTGVAKRLSLYLIKLMGRTPFGAIMAASLTNFIMAPMTPANTARTAAMLPIVQGLAEAYKAEPGKSNFGKALALSAAFGGNITASAFLTGTIANPAALSAVVAAVGASMYTSWSYWALAAAPTNLLILFIAAWLLIKLFPPEMKEVPGGIGYVSKELEAMGPMSGAEKRAILYFLIALGLWTTDRYHGLNSTMIAFIASALIYFPRIGVLDWRETQNQLPWELFMYFGGVLTLGAALMQSKAIEIVIKGLLASLGLHSIPEMTMLIILIGFTIFSHMIWSTTTAMAGVMLPIYVGIAQAMGFDVARFCLPLAIMIAYALFLPFNTMGNIIFLGTGFYTVSEQLKASLILGAIIWGLWIITAFTWWKVIGLT